MLKKAIVILANGFEEIEALAAIDILRRADVEVTVAGVSAKEIRGSHGVIVSADQLLNEAGSNFDCCVLPGGMPGAANILSSEKATSIINTMYAGGKIIAAICASPALVLAPLGILNNRSATCYSGMQDNFNSSTKYSKNNVVVDGNVITSRGPGTALLFALTIVEKLCGSEERDRLRKEALVTP